MLEHTLAHYGYTFAALFTSEGLARWDADFITTLPSALATQLHTYREGAVLAPLAESEFLLQLAPLVETYIAARFGLQAALEVARLATLREATVLQFKEAVVLGRARRYRGSLPEAAELTAWFAAQFPPSCADPECALAQQAQVWLADATTYAATIERLVQWSAYALQNPQQAGVQTWVSFHLPERLDYAQLVPLRAVPEDPWGRQEGEVAEFRRRDGFSLTDPRMNARAVQSEIHYCKYCHDHEGDFCAKGFPEKKGVPELGLKVNPLGERLTGCPLEERISEMHLLKREGQTLAALAMAMADNPMLPATGHRVCNDCMKACIYQKQVPVNIPQVETRILTDVLALPYGVEVYDLLTRWNPLRRRQYRMQAYTGHKVLIAGQGPAGFTLAHHLTLAGCAVVAVEGLKIEPVPEHWLTQPIRDYAEMNEDLDTRMSSGFGGVAEYGITVRWDKNFLRLIQVSLLRRPTYQLYGGVRFGGTLTLEDAWALGLDHVALATGTGLPKVLPIGNSLARGMRQATDFLMALQLTGAGKTSSLANLQLRMPVVVIGGGLTAIDTATEAQAYYLKQVEKTLARCVALAAAQGEAAIWAGLNAEDTEILREFLTHGQAVQAERQRAAAAGERPDFLPLLRAWGGVTLVYRKGLNSSPAYLRNHEEITQALAEGLYYRAGLEPLRLELDAFGHTQALVCRKLKAEAGRWLATREEMTLPAKAVLVAAGAQPNIIYEKEHPGHFQLEGDHFLPHICHQDALQPVNVGEHCKSGEFGAFTSYRAGNRVVSFLGDTHPVFQGSVVKAIASAQRIYPEILHVLGRCATQTTDKKDYPAFRAQMAQRLTVRLAQVQSPAPGVAELWIHAPQVAKNFQPGQFFRLQTYERLSPMQGDTRLQIPLLTVSGAGVRGDQVRLLLWQGSPAARLVAQLAPGTPLVLMGPNGVPTHLAGGTALIIASQWGSAVMLALGPWLRAQGLKVVLMVFYRQATDVLYQAELEAGSDHLVWCVAEGAPVMPTRLGDVSLVARDVNAVLQSYQAGQWPQLPALASLRSLLVMGAGGMLRALQQRLKQPGRGGFAPELQAVGAVGSPMQCMLKGVCAQCLQWQIDPETGQRTRPVFACAEQDQPLGWLDLENMNARMSQNRLAEQLTGLWLTHILQPSEASHAP